MKFLQTLTLIFCAILLAACGGGSSEEVTTPQVVAPAQPAPEPVLVSFRSSAGTVTIEAGGSASISIQSYDRFYISSSTKKGVSVSPGTVGGACTSESWTFGPDLSQVGYIKGPCNKVIRVTDYEGTPTTTFYVTVN